MKPLPLITGALLGISTSQGTGSPAPFDSAPYRFLREIPASPEEGIGFVPLDAHIFRFAGPDLRNLRLTSSTDEGETEHPHLVERVPSASAIAPETPIPARTVSFDRNEDGRLRIVTKLENSPLSAASIEIRTPLTDFEKDITVAGSRDGENWEPLVDDAVIFDREPYLDLRQTRIALPANSYRYFRVTVGEATDEQQLAIREIYRNLGDPPAPPMTERALIQTRPFRIDRLSFFTSPTERPPERRETEYPVEIESRIDDPVEKVTRIILETGNCPLRELALLTDDRNFRRRISVQVASPGAPDRWTTIHSGTVHRYDIAGFQEEQLSLRFGEHRSDRFRLLIENRDNPPLRISGFSGRGPIYRLHFHSAPGVPWRVYYGNDRTDPGSADYDVSALIRARAAEIPLVEHSLLPPRENAGFQAWVELPLSSWSRTPLIQRGVIAVVVICLIAVLIGAGRRLETAVPEGE